MSELDAKIAELLRLAGQTGDHERYQALCGAMAPSLARELLRLRAAVQAQDWRPMSEAPQDGTEIWIADAYDGCGAGRWDGRRWRATFRGDHVVEYMSDFGTDYKEHEVPTHWRPLPPPPDARAKEETQG